MRTVFPPTRATTKLKSIQITQDGRKRRFAAVSPVMLHKNYFLLHYFIWRLLNSDCQHPKALLIQLFKYKLIFTRLVVIISGGMQGESGNAREREREWWIERGRKRLRGVDSCVGSVFSFVVVFIYWLKLYSIGKWKPRTTGRIKREQQIQNRKTH